jgi:general secretion pathway protein F
LLDSGLSVTRALAAWHNVAPDTWGPVLPGIHAAVQRGESLGTALANAPFGIPPVVVGIIRAGEAGSGLGAAVRRAATLMENAAANRAAVRAALAYPMILAVAGAGAVVLLVGVVLPRFARILADLGQPLPTTTQVVLDAADLARAYAIPSAVALVILLGVWFRWTATGAGRERWDAWLLSLPIIGPIRGSAAAGRYAQALGALLETGVPISVALRSAADATGDAAIGMRVLRARDRVVRGERLSTALSVERASTPTALKLVRAGEESGRLAEMLIYAATLEQEQAERAVKAGVRLLEPAMILLFGGLVALVAAALLQAVYSVRPGV